MNQAFHDHFSGVANRYADFRPRYPERLFEYLASLVPRTARVWDCAAGNGQATHDLAARFAEVMATDASREQVASATPNPKVTFRVARAEASGLEDGSMDLITVAQALHWFEFDGFYAEVRRVLKPGGVLAVWAYGVQQVEGEAVNALVQDFYLNRVGPYWPPQRRWVEEGYRTIPFPFEEIAVPEFRLEAQWSLEQLLGYLGTWSATSRYRQATGQDPLAPLGEGLRRVWGAADVPRRVSWPLAFRVGRR